MIVIHEPEVRIQDGKALLTAAIDGIQGVPEIWFRTDKEYAPYFCETRSDAFAIPVLIHAMRCHMGVRMKAPISTRLYHAWTNYLSIALKHVCPEYSQLPIDCSTDSTIIPYARAVGTGLSCGIDSFFAVATHISSPQPEEFRLTHLTFFNAGNHAPTTNDQDKAKQFFDARADVVRNCARELQLALVVVDSNLDSVFERPFANLHTFRNLSVALSLQKLFKCYYYSAGYPAWDFKFLRRDSGWYDLFSVPLLSTENLNFYSAGACFNRVEKTRAVKDLSVSKKFLNVCYFKEHNCSICEKCMRTQVTLDVLGALKEYGAVFDLDLYNKNREWFIGCVLLRKGSHPPYADIYKAMNSNSFLTKPSLYYLFRWFLRLVVNKMKRLMRQPVPRF